MLQLMRKDRDLERRSCGVELVAASSSTVRLEGQLVTSSLRCHGLPVYVGSGGATTVWLKMWLVSSSLQRYLG